VDVPLIVAGALFVIWPLQYRRSIGGIRKRIAARDGQPQTTGQPRWRTAGQTSDHARRGPVQT
jgi:hypothetical protein